MTKPVNRPHKKPGRALKVPPADAGQRIERMASNAFSQLMIARGLGTSPGLLRQWLKENPALQEAYDMGIAHVEYTCVNGLYELVKKGNLVAIIFMLKGRFGWREGEKPLGGMTQVVVNLPGALPLDKYTGVKIEQAPSDPRALAITMQAKRVG